MRHLLSTILFVAITFSSILKAQELDITIENIRNQKGVIRLALFANEDGFRKEEPVWANDYPKCKQGNRSMHIKICIKEGTYGLSVLDDENNNGKMDYHFPGIPREGFGFSNYLQKGIQKPHFKDFCFMVEKNKMRIIVVKMKYF